MFLLLLPLSIVIFAIVSVVVVKMVKMTRPAAFVTSTRARQIDIDEQDSCADDPIISASTFMPTPPSPSISMFSTEIVHPNTTSTQQPSSFMPQPEPLMTVANEANSSALVEADHRVSVSGSVSVSRETSLSNSTSLSMASLSASDSSSSAQPEPLNAVRLPPSYDSDSDSDTTSKTQLQKFKALQELVQSEQKYLGFLHCVSSFQRFLNARRSRELSQKDIDLLFANTQDLIQFHTQLAGELAEAASALRSSVDFSSCVAPILSRLVAHFPALVKPYALFSAQYEKSLSVRNKLKSDKKLARLLQEVQQAVRLFFCLLFV